MSGHGLMHALMGRLFHWLQARRAPKLRPIDLSLGLPAVPQLAAQLQARQFEQFEQTFAQLTVDERFIALSALAQSDFADDGIDDWVASSTSFIAPLFKGTAVLYRAWQVRGGRVAAEVSAETFDAFEAMLEQSWGHLITAHRRAENEPEPLTRLIPVAMGLGVSRDTLDSIFEGYKKTGVPHLGATMYMVEAVSPKWLGSREEVFAFARAHAEHFPQQTVGIAYAHVEHWIYENKIRCNEASETYFSRKDVQQEICDCWQQEHCFANRTDYFRFAALNTYAFCFLMMQDDARLTDALNLIGHYCTPKPWEYVSLDPYWLFVTTRAELGLPELQERS
jgi:hypothetical protein